MKYKMTLLTLAVCVLLSACSGGGQEEPSASPEATVAETATQTPEPTEEAQAEETETAASEMTITDMAGREVTVPAEINTIFGVNNTASILLYTIAPEKMAAWNIKFSDEAKALMITECAGLPVKGNLYGSGKKAEPEEIIKLAPDIIVMAGVKANENMIGSADDLQAQLDIPVVIVLGKMATYDKTYEFLGELLSESERAKELGEYSSALVKEIMETSSTIADEDKISVYYSRGDDGLETEFAGSPNCEVLDMVGGINAIEAVADATSGIVNIEEVIAQDPKVILIGNQGASKNAAYEAITQSGLWDEISAVKDGKVIATPQYPFNWFDRPPTVNRLAGLIWLSEELYPDVYEYDVYAKIKEFFSLFYGVDVTDEQIDKLMK